MHHGSIHRGFIAYLFPIEREYDVRKGLSLRSQQGIAIGITVSFDQMLKQFAYGHSHRNYDLFLGRRHGFANEAEVFDGYDDRHERVMVREDE